MQSRCVALAAALSVLLAAPSWAAISTTVAETFDGTIEEASWRMGPDDEIVLVGGNPGAFLRNPATATPIPMIATLPGVPGVFTGSYRNMGVNYLGVDVNVFGISLAADDRPMSLGLFNNGNTPADPADDCEMVLSGKAIPRPGTGWRSYSFHVPAWRDSLPPKWIVYGRCASEPPDAVWLRVIGNVSQARFYLGDPGASYVLQIWDVGFDNPSITLGKGGIPPSIASEASE